MADSDKNIDDDYEFSRATYYELIEKGKESLTDMMSVAASTEHPRAYEVLGSLIKQISDVNDRLMDLNKKRKDIKKKEEDAKALPSGNVTNNLFVGSTTDSQRMILDQQKANQTIDITPKE